MNVRLCETDGKIMNQLNHLDNIIKVLGWGSVMDTRTIKPNIRQVQLHLRKKAQILSELFPEDMIPFATLSKQTVVDAINPLLIRMWHVQIIGGPNAASLQLLKKV